MGLDIRIVGTDLEYRDASNNVTSFTGNDIGGGGTQGAIRINTIENLIEYVDRGSPVKKRQLGATQIGTTETGTPRSLYIENGELRYVGEGETPFPIFRVENPPQAPSAQPSNLAVSCPADGNILQPQPWDAEVTWNNNTNNGDHIRIRWYRNGVLVENYTVSTTSTVSVTSSEHWFELDQLLVEMYYENDQGAGPVASYSETVSL